MSISRSIRKYLAGLLVVAAVGSVVWYVIRPVPPPLPGPGTRKTGDISMTGNELRGERDGKMVWQLRADTVEVDQDTQDSRLTTIAGEIFRDDGSVIHVVADRGLVDARRNFLLSGNIVAHSDDGMRLSCREMGMRTAENRVWARDGVEFSKPGFSLKCDLITSDAQLINLRAEGNVTAIRQ
ncbi:MAG: LPS export ABC transporter periplasmic protein LptC [Negativicutes bacterium]|nr:LPS export ABC transporter periplasmic protein LptC [Negativicutes bacterium]